MLAKQKATAQFEALIKSIRTEFKFGPQRIQTHLLRIHGLDLSSATIWRVLKKNEVPNLKKYRKQNEYTRYSRPIPGDRVQLDVTKIGPKCYQFTAIDDCTTMRALKLYHNRKAESTVEFLGYVLDTFLFPIQRIQTDWGTEFFNDLFQYELADHFIKFRPIKPRSPHLNGKVERSQFSDKSEFYATIPKTERNLELGPRLLQWQHFVPDGIMGVAAGTTFVDGSVNPSGTSVNGVAYDNNDIDPATGTELYALAVNTNLLYEIDPPNAGTLVEPAPVKLKLEGDGGFDIAPRNANVTTDIGLALYEVNKKSTLFEIDVETGETRILAKYKKDIMYTALAISPGL